MNLFACFESLVQSNYCELEKKTRNPPCDYFRAGFMSLVLFFQRNVRYIAI